MTNAPDEISAVKTPEKPCRRVGTVTFGLVMVLFGVGMLVSLFNPGLDFTWALKFSPLLLVSLGVETLLSARKGGRVKYDWVGMLLCFFIVCAALTLYIIAWCMLYNPDWVIHL